MSSIDVGSLVAQMRSLAAEAQGLGATAPARIGSPEVGRPETGFADVLENAIGQVNDTQQRAAALAEAFESGAANVDLAEVMVSLQKADLSFKAMTEVRNKLVSAYQEIMNMPI